MSESIIEQLLFPHSLNEFINEFWSKKPLFIKDQRRVLHTSLFNIDELPYLIKSTIEIDPYLLNFFDAIKDEKHQIPLSELSFSNIKKRYDNGATIRINSIHNISPRLYELCQQLSHSFFSLAHVNLYCTPFFAQGLPEHFDTHDVFILQVSGSKNWKIYQKPEMPYPFEYIAPLRYETIGRTTLRRNKMNSQQINPPEIKNAKDSVIEGVLAPGDLLYIPGGFKHMAWSTDEDSIHMTIGIYTFSFQDLLQASLQQVASRFPELRRPLPPILTNDLLANEQLKSYFFKTMELLKNSATPDEAIELISDIFSSQNDTFSSLHSIK